MHVFSGFKHQAFARWSTLTAASAALLTAAGFAWAQATGASDRSIEGTIRRFTTAPRGEIDGAVLDDGTRLHWPPHVGEQAQRVATTGDSIRVTGRIETGPAGDEHFEAAEIVNLRSRQRLNVDEVRPPRGDRGRGPRARAFSEEGPKAGEPKTIQGTIERFTTAPRGEVDGAVLDDGTVIHWPPHLEDRYAGVASQGDSVRATGRMQTGPAGDTHFEVQSLVRVAGNGRDEARREQGRAEGASRDNAGRGNAHFDRDSRARQLDTLQADIDRLQRELDALRRQQ